MLLSINRVCIQSKIYVQFIIPIRSNIVSIIEQSIKQLFTNQVQMGVSERTITNFNIRNHHTITITISIRNFNTTAVEPQ